MSPTPPLLPPPEGLRVAGVGPVPTRLFPCFQIKAEQLAVTKISERGKKQKKNWTTVWSELTSDQLTFYKQQQTAANQVVEFSLPLSFDVLWFALMSSDVPLDVFV